MSFTKPLNPHESQGLWVSISPYVVPPMAASAAIVLPFRDLMAKSAFQLGYQGPYLRVNNVLTYITFEKGLKEGFKAAPTVGAIVGTQMIVQSIVEKKLLGESGEINLSTTLISSAIVGAISAPVLAVFNGQTMGWTIRESLRKFSCKQGMAIAVQETAFVGGISVADHLAAIMKRTFGDNKAVDYAAAFVAGASGSLIGHPANTALTRWQNGKIVEGGSQLMWGSLRKARAIGIFSLCYKLGKDTLVEKNVNG